MDSKGQIFDLNENTGTKTNRETGETSKLLPEEKRQMTLLDKAVAKKLMAFSPKERLEWLQANQHRIKGAEGGEGEARTEVKETHG